MNTCSFYRIKPGPISSGYCIGTRECESCICQGNESKCDFYPKKRNKKITTLEMMNLAKETGKTYRSTDMLYNATHGFFDDDMNPWPGRVWEDDINDLFEYDNWKEDDTIYMKKSEAEEKYGIKIVGD